MFKYIGSKQILESQCFQKHSVGRGELMQLFHSGFQFWTTFLMTRIRQLQFIQLLKLPENQGPMSVFPPLLPLLQRSLKMQMLNKHSRL
jgi:hypothetical protein